MIFDERLTKLRKELNINQKECAALLEIEGSKYNKWENGKTVPDFETVIKLAKFFDVSVDYLIGNSDAKRPENENVIKELGLTEDSIKTICKIKTSFAKIEIPGLEDDDRVLLDVFNEFVSSNQFISFLTAMQVLTKPNYHGTLWQVDDEKLAILKIPLNQKNIILYETMIKMFLDDIIKRIKTKKIAKDKGSRRLVKD